jgi:hypothetical protein
MPTRKRPSMSQNMQQENPDQLIDTPVDLSFLPEQYLSKINSIFDSYFGLGMKKSSMQIEDDFTPTFPNNMSSLSSPELGDILGEYTAWYSFTIDKSKYIGVALNYIEEELREIVDEKLGEMVDSKGNIEAKKSKARSSMEYKSIIMYAHRLRGMKAMLESELTNYDKCIATLSREVSRREHSGGF